MQGARNVKGEGTGTEVERTIREGVGTGKGVAAERKQQQGWGREAETEAGIKTERRQRRCVCTAGNEKCGDTVRDFSLDPASSTLPASQNTVIRHSERKAGTAIIRTVRQISKVINVTYLDKQSQEPRTPTHTRNRKNQTDGNASRHDKKRALIERHRAT
ncbi:hypothetical protein Pcinc_042658 [Petrolisthes cinctipes]|uniref:Uncharacterized protein n=1 Tax=Petrolisthes cinctipes TaxID=88211 RepID=A0AAE1EFP5_PETCI|nr:hypothetical protein Pcinc_042658 [Petrolisthes cinctipes]